MLTSTHQEFCNQGSFKWRMRQPLTTDYRLSGQLNGGELGLISSQANEGQETESKPLVFSIFVENPFNLHNHDEPWANPGSLLMEIGH